MHNGRIGGKARGWMLRVLVAVQLTHQRRTFKADLTVFGAECQVQIAGSDPSGLRAARTRTLVQRRLDS